MKAIILCTEPHSHSKDVHKLTRPRGTDGSKGARTLGTRSEKHVQGKGPGACFSKVPKLFGRISGDIILFVSSKRKRLEARNFAVIFIFIPFTTY